MATEILEVQIKLDTGEVKNGFISITRDAKAAGEKAGEGLGGGFSKGQAALIAVSEGLNLVKEGIAIVKEISDKAFEFAKAGEEIDAITKRFDILGEQVGLIPETIKSGIEKAVGGTVAMSDALQTASKAFIELGANADRLPEVFELARKAAQVFGGDTTDRVEAISRAIETGSTRQLRNIGLTINSSKVYAEYANKLGVTAGFLSEAQKQQALMNEVLEKGGEKFKTINETITPLAETFKKSTVAGKELGETFAIAFDRAFGSIIKAKIDSTTSSLQILNIKLGELLLGKVPTAAENVKLLTREIENLIKSQDLASVHGDIGRVEELGKEISGLQQKLNLQKQITQSEAFQEATTKARGSSTEVTKRTFEQEEILRKLRTSAAVALSADLKAIFDARKKDEDTFYASSENVAEQYGIAFKAENLKSEQEIAAIKLQYKDLSVSEQEKVNGLIQQKEIEHSERMRDIAKGLSVDLRLANGDFAANTTSNFSKVKTEALALGAAFKNGLVNSIVTGVQSIGNAILTGKNLFGAFGSAILGVFGNLATQIGTVMIGTGIAIDSLKALDGLAAVAAGIGLVAVGSVLSALSGGGNSSAPASLPPTSVGGGIASAPGTSSTSLSTAPAQAGPSIYVHVQGDVLDSQDTGHRLFSIIANNFQATGNQLPAGVVMA